MSGNKELVKQFFERERKKHRRTVVLRWVVVGTASLAVPLAWQAGINLGIIANGLATGIGFGCVLALLYWIGTDKRTLEERLGKLLDNIEFGWEELQGLGLNDGETEHLHIAFGTTAIGRLTTNESYLRTRGFDEKGPAFGEPEAHIDANGQRVDPLMHERDYEGLEGDLGVAEQLVEEANQQYADEAQRQWDIAEAQDMDNIEAGVKRLGDLVATGWFEQNAKDGAVEEVMNSHRQDEAS